MRLPPNRLMQSLTNQTKPNASALNTLAIEQHSSQTPRSGNLAAGRAYTLWRPPGSRVSARVKTEL